MDLDSESKLISLISQTHHSFLAPVSYPDSESKKDSKIISLINQIVSLVRSMDSDSQPKPESKLMSLVTQIVSLFSSMDLDSLPEPLSKLISLITQNVSTDSDQKWESDSDQKSEADSDKEWESDSDQKSEADSDKEWESESDQKSESDLNFNSLLYQTLRLKPDPELMSLIRQVVSVVVFSMNSEWKKLISLCPQVKVSFDEGKFSVSEEVEHEWRSLDKRNCFLQRWDTWEKFKLTGEDDTHFRCSECNGENHGEYEKAPVEIKHPLHQKHSLQLVLNLSCITRKCYCCDEDLIKVFYYCSSCDYAMNIACVEKAPLLSISHPKWHEHTLALFPRMTSLTCDVCALADSNCPFYICPPCDFVVHLHCIKLPRVIRISRHPHRITFTSSFGRGDWSCSICRKEINNDYGVYSCIKKGCSYGVHSKCATQRNVWDGIDLEGVPEEIEEVVEPFVRIGDKIIRHFSHDHHHLWLDENTSRDYDENKQCHACIMPIYFGNFYSCVKCEFVLHETCANLSRKIYHPIHPHMFTLALLGANGDDMGGHRCSACYRSFATGLFYECSKEECYFKLHLQCATISEPLVHESHVHPLFLTSKPGERRTCCVCQHSSSFYTDDTFNCIEGDGFSLCFKCASIPQKVRYKHDKHILTLAYGEETSTMTYWCEVCERKINPRKGFYMCDEYCCATIHIECLIGRELYMKHDSYYKGTVAALSNNHMTRPICSECEKRCSDKIFFQCSGFRFCSLNCIFSHSSRFV